MKTVLVLLFCAGVALAYDSCSSQAECGSGHCCLLSKVCFPKLQKYVPCNGQDIHKCGCKEGLSCQVTREFTIAGQKIQIKQCMPTDEQIITEQLTEQDVYETLQPGSTAAAAPAPNARWYPGKKCTKEVDCVWPNTCCLFESRCAFKLPKYFTCYFTSKHKCDCMNGYVCKTTTSIKLPIIGVPFPVRQCVPKDEA